MKIFISHRYEHIDKYDIVKGWLNEKYNIDGWTDCSIPPSVNHINNKNLKEKIEEHIKEADMVIILGTKDVKITLQDGTKKSWMEVEANVSGTEIKNAIFVSIGNTVDEMLVIKKKYLYIIPWAVSATSVEWNAENNSKTKKELIDFVSMLKGV